jgi:hypothetical protein
MNQNLTQTEFEPTGTFCYAFARDVVIPTIKMQSDVTAGAPFRLVDKTALVIDEHLSNEQQSILIKRPKSDGEESVRRLIKFYTERVAKEGKALVWLGSGMYRVHTAADVSEDELDAIDDAAVEDAETDGDAVASEFDGQVYAFSFPMLVKDGSPFPIKVGMTTGDVGKRVETQCKGSATFENPVILGKWEVKRVGAFESAIHNILKVRGKWRENAPGTEWFDTTLEEISQIVALVKG